MRRLFLLVFIIFAIVPAFAMITEHASLQKFIYGKTPDCSYDNFASHITEGLASPGYNIYAPYDPQTNGFGSYTIPTAAQLTTWNGIMQAFANQDWDLVDVLLTQSGFPYELVEFHDIDYDRTYYILREQLNMNYLDTNGTDFTEDDEVGSFDYSWGLYIFNPDSQNPIILTAPHPNDDFPTVPMTYFCFVKWDARYMIFSSCGRETVWNNQNPYNNSKTLCDASRVLEHAFNKGYQLFCDEIRTTFGTLEFSAQLHSYDWNGHLGYNNLQVSVGYNFDNPSLPLRDFSSRHLDFVNALGYNIHPANTIGIHEPVTMEEYLTVHNETDYLPIFEGDSIVYHVSNHLDLWGYQQNRQGNYSSAGWNDYDVRDGFFHLEMDELPSAYVHNQTNYKWFYGYDAEAERFDHNKYFEHVIDFYMPWVDAMAEILPAMIAMDDEETPAVINNINIATRERTSVLLKWDYCDSYDFKTYEIIWANEPITADNFEQADRSTDEELAESYTSEFWVEGLDADSTYYFKIRAVDYNGNASEWTQEIYTEMGTANVASLRAVGLDSQVRLSWFCSSQENNQGFVVYRSEETPVGMQQIASYTDTPTLASDEGSTAYTYFDETAINGITYFYQIASIDSSDTEYLYNPVLEASPETIFTIKVANEAGTFTDSVMLGVNRFASNGYDGLYDVRISSNVTGDYVHAHLYEPRWQDGYKIYEKELYGYYDMKEKRDSWTMRFKTNQLNQPIIVSLNDFNTRGTTRIVIKDNTTNEYVDLTRGDYSFTVTSSAYRTFTIYAGYVTPKITFSNIPNQIFDEGETLHTVWNADIPVMIDSVDVYIKSPADSIMIAAGQPFAPNLASWSIPAETSLTYAKVYLDAYLADGEVVTYESPYTVGTLPTTRGFAATEGWSTMANPYVDVSGISDILGDGAEVAVFDGDEYDEADEFAYGSGYWIYTPTGNQYSGDVEISDSYFVELLDEGWNLIPNPDMAVYDLTMLEYIYNGVNYTYSEAIQYELIAPVHYTYADESYRMVKKVYPQQSFFIYSHYDELGVKFTPFNSTPNLVHYPGTEFAFPIEASQALDGYTDTDEIVIATGGDATDGFDRFYDLPEPPCKPMDKQVRFFIDKGAGFGYHSEYNQEVISLNHFADTLLTWDVCIQVDTLLEVTVKFENSLFQIPENHFLYLIMDGVHYDLTQGEAVSFIPSVYDNYGTIEITTTEFVSSGEKVVQARVTPLSNYPNPFNPVTCIKFSVAKKAKVELDIYNIKGQKVKCLVNDELERGEKEFYWKGKNDNGKSVSSGVYFSKLKVGNQVQTKKMLLLK